MAHLRALAVPARREGRLEEATGYLEEAAGLAREMGVLGDRWQVEVALGEVYLTRGEVDAARRAYISAGEILRLLGERIEDEEVRAGFVSAGGWAPLCA